MIGGRECKVLIVDDIPEMRTLLRESVEDEVEQVFEAENGGDALAFLRGHPVDLVFLDLNMPGIPGLEVLEKIRDLRPKQAVIIVSAEGNKENLQAALRLSADNFIDKPIQPEMLRLAMRKAVEASRYEELIDEMLDLFILDYTKLDFTRVMNLSRAEKEKTLRAALGLAKVQILKKKFDEIARS